MRMLFVTSFILASVQPTSPQAAVDELIAADRAFATAAADRTATAALTAMFADDVVLMAPPPRNFARGKAAAAAALASNPDNVSGRLHWAPIRGGIAADGRHGFTVGYMTLRRPDGGSVPLKYVAYWIKQSDGWRVAVLKRAVAKESPAHPEMLPPALPDRLLASSTDGDAIAKYKASLDRAERAFSDEAQTIGLGAAFAKHGSADAVNVGPPSSPTFVFGAEAIGRSVGAGQSGGSSVRWAPDDVIVASSGDLGVTFGMITFNTPPASGPAAVPFITVWRRASPSAPWRYVAE